jgi:hypothetical protein
MAAAATSLFCALFGATAAHAATVTVTGDDGNPVPIAAGTPTAIRNMDTKVGVAFPSNNGYFSMSVTGPDGVAVATALTCFGWDSWSRYTDFRGNGNYTVTVTNYAKSDTTCKTPTSTETYVPDPRPQQLRHQHAVAALRRQPGHEHLRGPVRAGRRPEPGRLDQRLAAAGLRELDDRHDRPAPQRAGHLHRRRARQEG